MRWSGWTCCTWPRQRMSDEGRQGTTALDQVVSVRAGHEHEGNSQRAGEGVRGCDDRAASDGARRARAVVSEVGQRTMSMPFEFEEAQEIPASHLLRTRCAGCGGQALAAPGRERDARCASCWGGSQVVSPRAMAYTVPAGYPLGPAPAVEAGHEPYPAPAVSSRNRLTPVFGYPDVVTKLAREAGERGWRTETAWARGCLPHATTGRPGRAEDSFRVKFARGPWAAWAIYRGAGWKFLWIWGQHLLPFGMCNVTDLKVWLSDPDQPQQWYEGIRERIATAEANRKAREQCNKGIHDQVRVGVGPLAWRWCERCEGQWLAEDAPWRKERKAREGAT